MTFLICGIEKEMMRMSLTYKTERDSQAERMNLMVAGGERWGDGIVREFGMNMYTLLYSK